MWETPECKNMIEDDLFWLFKYINILHNAFDTWVLLVLIIILVYIFFGLHWLKESLL